MIESRDRFLEAKRLTYHLLEWGGGGCAWKLDPLHRTDSFPAS